MPGTHRETSRRTTGWDEEPGPDRQDDGDGLLMDWTVSNYVPNYVFYHLDIVKYTVHVHVIR